jgi:hypothetical protein
LQKSGTSQLLTAYLAKDTNDLAIAVSKFQGNIDNLLAPDSLAIGVITRIFTNCSSMALLMTILVKLII